MKGLFGALHYHWVYDTEQYELERNRVQLAAVLLIIAFTGSRPGAVVESGTAGLRGSNEALRYRDIKIMVLQADKDQEEALLIVEVTFMFIKGRRHRSAPWVPLGLPIHPLTDDYLGLRSRYTKIANVLPCVLSLTYWHWLLPTTHFTMMRPLPLTG